MNKWDPLYYGVSEQDCLDYSERENARGSTGIGYKVEKNGTEGRPWVLYFRFEEIKEKEE